MLLDSVLLAIQKSYPSQARESSLERTSQDMKKITRLLCCFTPLSNSFAPVTPAYSSNGLILYITG
ncbi:MAG: hypothetical protein ACHQXG_10335 [Nitrososphaerales archaeon]